MLEPWDTTCTAESLPTRDDGHGECTPFVFTVSLQCPQLTRLQCQLPKQKTHLKDLFKGLSSILTEQADV